MKKIKIHILLFVILFIISSNLSAKNLNEINAKKFACEKLNYKDKTYINSVEKLMGKQEVINWLEKLKNVNSNLALNSNFDKTIFQMKKCYWSINFYESNIYKMTLWKTFEVEINGEKIYELDDINPDKKSLIPAENTKGLK